MFDVVRYERVRSAIDGSFQHHLITWIAQLRAPLKMNVDRLHQRGKFRQELLEGFWGEPMNQPMLRTPQHVFVFQEERWGGQENQAPVFEQWKNRRLTKPESLRYQLADPLPPRLSCLARTKTHLESPVTLALWRLHARAERLAARLLP